MYGSAELVAHLGVLRQEEILHEFKRVHLARQARPDSARVRALGSMQQWFWVSWVRRTVSARSII